MKRSWKGLAVIACLLASLSILISVALFSAVQGYSRDNCRDNLAQDRALSKLLGLSLRAGDPGRRLTTRQEAARQEFVRYIDRVRHSPPCPGGAIIPRR
jgi:hypothetical protein